MRTVETELLGVNGVSIQKAAMLLRSGKLVGIPTETVYGLAANACDADAVAGIFKVKGRPQDNPLIVHISGLDMLADVAALVPPAARKLAAAFWPGPLTMVLPRGKAMPDVVSAGMDTVGVRMPSHPAALAVIKAAGVPLAAPSANLSGSPSPTTAEHVKEDFNGRIPLILDGGPCQVGVESTVISLVGQPTVLRPGYITPQQLQEALGQEVKLSPTLTRPLQEGEKPTSPGMKYRHYAPKAELTLVRGSFKNFEAMMEEKRAPGVFALCFEGEQGRLPVPAIAYGIEENAVSQAAELYAALRRLDDMGAHTVYARMPQTQGVGLAVYNRMLRAAAFREIEV